MANQLLLNGAQQPKTTHFTSLYNATWSSGLWTNRSPLRDAVTQRWQARLQGPAGDAFIDGLNTEVTNRLTLARRPGNSVFDANSYTSVNTFYPFHLFSTNTEQIILMIDEANELSYLVNGVKTLLLSKSPGAGQSYMQEVGNILYIGDGIDNAKWLQSLFQRVNNTQIDTGVNPFLTTFFIDPNNNIQQLLATKITNVSDVTYVSATNLLTLTVTSTSGINTDDLQVVWGLGTVTWLNGIVIQVISAVGTTVTAKLLNEIHADQVSTPDTGVLTIAQGGFPTTGLTPPTWNTVTPDIFNNFQGGITEDGTVVWVNRGNPLENWGIIAPKTAPTVNIGSSRVAWIAHTFYSLVSVVIDSNGNLQQVTTAGKSGNTTPTWATSVGLTTTDGTVVWTMIQTAASLVWAAHTHYAPGAFVVGSASGDDFLFKLADITTPFISGTINCFGWNDTGSGGFNKFFPAPAADFTFTAPSLSWHGNTGQNTQMDVINGAGEITGQTDTGHYENWETAITGTIHIRVPGQYSFNLSHDDGAFWAIGDGAQKISGVYVDSVNHGVTAKLGFNQITGINQSGSTTVDPSVWNFPTVGDYRFEIDWTNWQHASRMVLTCNGQTLITTTDISGAAQPIWPVFSTAFAPNYASVTESANQYRWDNIGFTTDFVWIANTNFTLPNTIIIDGNGNNEAPFRTGATGTTTPTFATGLNQLTNDNPNLIWINQGAASAPPPGTITAFTGFQYTIALVNTLDNTVSNASPLTPSTGPFIGATGVAFAPGSGLDINNIDPQADAVAIFRTTDGQAIQFLIPGKSNDFYTVNLSTYLQDGYFDDTLDTGLNNLISAAIAGENTPPLAGAINLTYHLSRIFFSIGNVIYWTAGPDTPVGNGTNGVPPLNFNQLPSLVKRIVPTGIGVLVFTVSDIYIIQGLGTGNSPIQKAQPYLPGIGLLSYNALALNGSLIGLYTTDRQFLILDPSSGTTISGHPIANLLRLSLGTNGKNWNPSTAYVTWHTNGDDQAWYLSDGSLGWFRLSATPSPETGVCWSPFAAVVNGAKAVQSIETSPGVHKLLVGPFGTGSILQRDLDVFTDNGTAYNAYAVLGSIVLAEPGQIAEVSFVTIDSVLIGNPTVIGVLINEALPYFNGPFETLTRWSNDPFGLPTGRSILGQRFYLSELQDQTAMCRHMQIMISFGVQSVQNELLTLSVYGAYNAEL